MQIDGLRADVERILKVLEPERIEDPVKAEQLRRVDDALARQLEHRKRFFQALERLEALACP